MDKGQDSWDCSAWRGFLINVYKYLKERYKEERACLFSAVMSDKARGNRHKLKLRRTPLNFTVRAEVAQGSFT